MNKSFFEKRIKHIEDEDLFASLKPGIPAMKSVRRAFEQDGRDAASLRWTKHLSRRLKRSGTSAGARVGREDLRPDQVIEEADLVVARDIKCWGGVRIKYKGEIDFSKNLGGSSNYGFHYCGWLSPLHGAYRLTGDEKYARAFVEIFTQWYRQRDLVVGDHDRLDVIWYELGCNRARTFRSLYFSMIDSAAVQNMEFHEMMLKTILVHGRWLYQHQTEYRSGNWQVFGAQTLTGIGLSFPEFRESGRWVRRGLKWILEHTRRDVYRDGCHKERAPHYHLGVVNSFWDVYTSLIGVRGVRKQRDRIVATMEQMLLWTHGMSIPSGHSPTVGDSEYDIPQGHYLNVGLATGNSRLLWASGASAREMRSKAEELSIRRRVRPGRPSERSVHHDSSEFAIVRSGWGAEDLYFNVNYGPYGGGHSHSEALAFQMWAKGRPLCVDCGRGLSYDDPLHRSWYTQVHAHNTVAVDGEGPSVKGRRGRFCFWEKQGRVDLLGFTHRGYKESDVGHRRCFLVNKAKQYAVVLDFLTCETGHHTYEWILNTPESIRISKGRAAGEGITVAEGGKGGRFRKSPATMALPIEGRSTWGMKREKGTNLRIEKEGGSVDFQVLIAPYEKGTLSVQQLDSRSRYRLRIEVGGDHFQHGYDLDLRKGLFL
tara:strand:- start:742 stop:2700 length:1959 start_codon:yes stop_codon:yes gene_type:complete